MRKKKPIPAVVDQNRIPPNNPEDAADNWAADKDHDGQGYRRRVQRCDGCAATAARGLEPSPRFRPASDR